MENCQMRELGKTSVSEREDRWSFEFIGSTELYGRIRKWAALRTTLGVGLVTLPAGRGSDGSYDVHRWRDPYWFAANIGTFEATGMKNWGDQLMVSGALIRSMDWVAALVNPQVTRGGEPG